jgi:hypothetical protein
MVINVCTTYVTLSVVRVNINLATTAKPCEEYKGTSDFTSI